MFPFFRWIGPGVIWAIHPPKLDPFAQNSGTLLVEILEKTFGIATILLLVVVVTSTPLLGLWEAGARVERRPAPACRLHAQVRQPVGTVSVDG